MAALAEELIATVLPPGEGFGPGRSGAIGLMVRRLTRIVPALVIGGPQAGPAFEDVPFREARPSRWQVGNINLRYAAGVARVVRQVRPVLLEVHNRPEVALALTRRFPELPVVLFLHNDPQGMRRARRPRQRLALLRRLAAVVTVSEFLARRFKQGLPPDGPCSSVVVMPNAIELAALPEARAREKLMLFAGRVVPEKGPDRFVAACAAALPLLPGWRAAVIGADRFRADAPETAFVRSVGVAARAAGVDMLGYHDHPAVLEALSCAAIAVVPSCWDEPFGLAALEAMACGAALVCSARGGLPEVAGDAAIYADPDDPAEMAAALVGLAQDARRRDALAEAGRVQARRFGVVAAAARLAELRRRILADGGSGRSATLYHG